MAAKEDYYSFVEGDDIDSIILDRNILPLRKFPLARGEDICYLIQNVAGRILAFYGDLNYFQDFKRTFRNSPLLATGDRTCFNQIEQLESVFFGLHHILSECVNYSRIEFIKKEANVPDSSTCDEGSGVNDVMRSLGFTESLGEELETIEQYFDFHVPGKFISFENSITFFMDLFWNKMMRPVVIGNFGGMYFLDDLKCRFVDVKIYGTRRLYNDVSGETVNPIDHWDYLISISKPSTHSSDIFTPVGFTYQTKTILGNPTWSHSPFLWPRYRARFTDGQKNKLYFLFYVSYVRRENRDDEVKEISTLAYVNIPRNEVSIETLKGKVMDYVTEIGVDTSDPTGDDGYVSLNVEIRDVFAILEFTDQMTINTKGNDQ